MITLREDFGGLWWPDYDHKPEACYSKVTRRSKDVELSAELCARHRVCVQAGGHAGVWPEALSKWFDRVWTFEPEQALYRCLLRNVAGNEKIIPVGMALGDAESSVMMKPHVSAGSWSISSDGTVPVRQVTIDSLNLMYCDLIVLDVERYEVPALRGARSTIERCRPVIHVEAHDEVREYLASIGYTLVKKVHADEIWRR